MMGQRRFECKLYYEFSLERLVPEDHLLRRISAAVDFSFVRPLCRPFYSHTGQPSVDPVVLFKLLLIGSSTALPRSDGWPKRCGFTSATAGSSVTTSTSRPRTIASSPS